MDSLEGLNARLEPVAYLARSPSRLKVLVSIDEAPRTRRELRDMTDVSRVTLSRILANFEDRGWIRATNGTYEVTTHGASVAEELAGVLDNLAAIDHLDGAMEWLPVEAFDFDLSRLADATVTTSDWGDHTAQIRRVADLLRGSDRIRATGSGVSRDVLEAMWECAVNDGAAVTAIIDDTALESVRADATMAEQTREIAASKSGAVLRYAGDDEPLLMVTVCDDTVILCGHDRDGPPPGTLDTTDAAVLDWAESYIERVAADSRPLEPPVLES